MSNNIFGRHKQKVEGEVPALKFKHKEATDPAKVKKFESAHNKTVADMQEEIAKFNFKIQFKNPTWVLKEETVCGFTGTTKVSAAKIKSEAFGVLSVTEHKKNGCSKIHVWSDGCCDGNNVFLINVPNGLFKQVKDE